MTNAQRQDAVRNLLQDLILDLLETAAEDRLIEIYAMLKGPVTQAPTPNYRKLTSSRPPTPSRTSDSGSYPAATSMCVRRALERMGRPCSAREIIAEVHREQPAIADASIRGALSRMVSMGEVAREGTHGSSVYSLS